MPDDEINQRIVNPVPRGAKLFTVIDACHSGSACDLPYMVNEKTGFRWVSTYQKNYTRCAECRAERAIVRAIVHFPPSLSYCL
jgi:hypothetical protein